MAGLAEGAHGGEEAHQPAKYRCELHLTIAPDWQSMVRSGYPTAFRSFLVVIVTAPPLALA
jgi:hypothetical protein